MGSLREELLSWALKDERGCMGQSGEWAYGHGKQPGQGPGPTGKSCALAAQLLNRVGLESRVLRVRHFKRQRDRENPCRASGQVISAFGMENQEFKVITSYIVSSRPA